MKKYGRAIVFGDYLVNLIEIEIYCFDISCVSCGPCDFTEPPVCILRWSTQSRCLARRMIPLCIHTVHLPCHLPLLRLSNLVICWFAGRR